MTTPADVVAAARRQLRVRWVHQHRLPGVALDCAGLVICVARELGLVAPDFDVTGYSRSPDGTLLDVCDRFMQPVAEPVVGGVVVLRMVQDPQHLAIVGDYPGDRLSVIHACAVRGEVIEHRLMFHERLRLVRAYRLPGVTA